MNRCRRSREITNHSFLAAARLPQSLCAKEMFDAIDLSKFVVTPLTDSEFAELSVECDRRIPDSVRQLLQTIGVPQNFCYSLPEDEDTFLSYQRGIPTEYCVFARDDSDDNLYAVGPDDSLFKLDPHESAIHKHSGSVESWLLERVNEPTGDGPVWQVQLSFTTNNEQLVLDLLSRTFQLTDLADWQFKDKSPADVVTHHRNCIAPEGPSCVSRQEYHGWQTPIFYFNRDIPSAGIRESKAAFRTFKDADVGFKLINYGVF